MDDLQLYLFGDEAHERVAIETLRRIGEAAARHAGMQARDVDEIGVDFAGFILTERADSVRACADGHGAYLRRSAHWFVTHQRRQAWARRVVLVEQVEETEQMAAPEPPVDEVATAVLRRDLWERLERVVSHLPEPDQRLYEICIRDGSSCAEAAERLKCKPAAARKRLERLRRHVRELLQAQY